MFVLVLAAWMLLWTFDAALSAPDARKVSPPGPLAAIGSVTVDGGRACMGILAAPRQVLADAACLRDAGRWLPADGARFVAGLKDRGFQGAARVLSYRLLPQAGAARSPAPSGEDREWVLLELDGGLGDAVEPQPEMHLDSLRSVGIGVGHPKLRAF